MSARACSVLLLTLAGCSSLAEEKSGPSPAEVQAIVQRIDDLRDVVLRYYLEEVDESAKSVWRRVLRELGDGRERILRAKR